MKRFYHILSLLLAFVLVLQIFPFSLAEEGSLPLWDEEWQMLLLANRERLKVGQAPLTTTDFLQEGAGIRAVELQELFSHDRPDGSACFSVLDEVGAPMCAAAGENIAFGFFDATDVTQGWVNSPGHYSNMIDPDFVHVGVGAVVETRNWAQLFFSGEACSYENVKLSFLSGNHFKVGTTIDEMMILAEMECKNCGTSYLPLMNEFCSDYQPDQAGHQDVTVRFFDFEFSFSVALEEEPTPPTSPFADVISSEWYFDAVCFAVHHGLMNGMGENRLIPNGNMTRAMLVTVLWRYVGSPDEGELTFTDVPSNEWYAEAVAWAAHNGIVGGVGNNKFDPNGNITREQIAAILYRYAGSNGIDTTKRADLSAFPDANRVSAYANDAIGWAVAEGLINGSDGKLQPLGNATRAQVAAILMRFIQNVIN
ncbi:MAG: hypothetical protein E7467_02305 [Ruminococcaceae bacterium]|nr:hypothetical protein [Oscillospiraceae bacterium]